MRLVLLTVLTLTLAAVASARADIIEFDEDREGWEAAVGAYSTADFVGLPVGPFESDVYAHLGMLIVEPLGSSYTVAQPGKSFRDGAGIHGWGPLELWFDAPVTGLALDFNGACFATLFRDGIELGTTSEFGPSGLGFFAGIISTVAFDRVVLSEFGPEPTLSIDDIHFGPPIPAPPTLGVVALATLLRSRRRRVR